jgi:ADP-ribose pyrophosphatase
MDEKKWTRLSKETVLTTRWYTLSHDRYVLPDGQVGDYHYIDIPGAAMVVPLSEGGELVLVRQHRYLMGRDSVELPSGGMKVGSDPLATARAELREEAGYDAARWQPVGEFAPYNGASNELCHLFVAEDLTKVEAEPDATEEMEVLSLPLDGVLQAVRAGEIWDGMTLAALCLYQLWRAEGRSDATPRAGAERPMTPRDGAPGPAGQLGSDDVSPAELEPEPRSSPPPSSTIALTTGASILVSSSEPTESGNPVGRDSCSSVERADTSWTSLVSGPRARSSP